MNEAKIRGILASAERLYGVGSKSVKEITALLVSPSDYPHLVDKPTEQKNEDTLNSTKK